MTTPTDTEAWMQTVSGKMFYPTNPTHESIDIEDIAYALSHICRYGGHCLQFYSVAQHCVHVADVANVDGYGLAGLLHDAAEAYIGDMVRPLKYQIPQYRDIEFVIETVLAEKFGVEYPWPDAVKRADNKVLADEMAVLMSSPPAPWTLPEKGTGMIITPWDSNRAREEFLESYAHYAKL